MEKLVSGRRALVQMLDCMWAEEANIRKMHDAMQINLDEDPVKHFEKIVMPLLPKQLEVALEDVKEYKDMPEGSDDTDA